MKIYLAALACLMLSGGLLYAQKSTYLKAEVGFGRSNVRERSRGIAPTSNWRAIPAGRLALSGGVQVKKLNVEIGFGYARTGGRSTDSILLTSYANPAGAPTTLSATQRIQHITIPMSVGYELRAGKRWAIQPRLGLEGAYTASSKTGNQVVTNRPESLGLIEATGVPVKQFSLHGTSALHLHYRVTPSIEIFGGPSYRHMLTNGAKETLYVQPPYYQLRTSSATFDAGVKLRLNRTSPAQRAPQE